MSVPPVTGNTTDSGLEIHYYLSAVLPAALPAFLERNKTKQHHSAIQELQVYSFLLGLILRDGLASLQAAGLSAYMPRWNVDEALR